MRKAVRISAALTLLCLCGTALALDSASFHGRPPSFQPGNQTGAAVWTEGGRLHVEFAARGGAQDFDGRVCARSQLTGLRTHRLESKDSVRLGPKGRCVWLRLRVHQGVDGFSVELPDSTLIVDLRDGKRALPPQQIWVGKSGAHPDSSPFALPVAAPDATPPQP